MTTRSGSYPFMNIADDFGLPYGDLLLFASSRELRDEQRSVHQQNAVWRVYQALDVIELTALQSRIRQARGKSASGTVMAGLERIAARASEAPPLGCSCFNDDQNCVCLDAEKVIRAFAGGQLTGLTPEERESLLAEIEKVEGHDRDQYVGADDRMLARGVLDAWTDYCRDKGLL